MRVPQRCGLRHTEAIAQTDSIIVRDPEIPGGEPVFLGTRVPFQALLDYLEAGDTLDEFLEHFPGVTRDMAVAALESEEPLRYSFLAFLLIDCGTC
jgi:uncharacterized protein (DUF433 family)